MKIVVFGTADTSKPRTRIVLNALKTISSDLIFITHGLFDDVVDKSRMNKVGILGKIFTMIYVYPVLIIKYLLAQKHDLVFVPYFGLFDVLVVKLFARMRKTPLVWDMFLSVYDTTVIDRKMVKKESLFAKSIYFLEKRAVQSANLLLMDTKTHADYIRALYTLKDMRIAWIWVGAEKSVFENPSTVLLEEQKKINSTFEVLFYGQFIPLHGIDTIIEVARIISKENNTIHFTIIGTGQESARIDKDLEINPLANVTRIAWVDYTSLISYIKTAHCGLGVFPKEGKGLRVIPNKIFQMLMGKLPVITAQCEPICQLIETYPKAPLLLVPTDNAFALAKAISKQAQCPTRFSITDFPSVDEDVVRGQIKKVLDKKFN